MSRTPNDPLYSGSGSTSGSTSGADSFGVTGTGAGQSAATGAYGSTSGSGLGGNVADLDLGSTGGSQQGVADRLNSAKDAAGEKLGQAKDIAGEKLGQAKEKATQLKSTLADKLEAGASSLRRQGQPGDTLGLAAGGSAAADAANPQLQKLASTGADALQASADFLRNGDLKSSIEAQVRTNPGRTLLIALGVGYALGKVIRGSDSSSSSSSRRY